MTRGPQRLRIPSRLARRVSSQSLAEGRNGAIGLPQRWLVPHPSGEEDEGHAQERQIYEDMEPWGPAKASRQPSQYDGVDHADDDRRAHDGLVALERLDSLRDLANEVGKSAGAGISKL